MEALLFQGKFKLKLLKSVLKLFVTNLQNYWAKTQIQIMLQKQIMLNKVRYIT